MLLRLVSSLIHLHVDYCNCLLAGHLIYSLDHLQVVQNAAARLVCGLCKFDQVTPALSDELHWLLMQQRITCKLCCLTFKGLHSEVQPYITEHCKPVLTIDSCCRLHSASRSQLIIPRAQTEFVKDFMGSCLPGPSAWNNLPTNVILCTTTLFFHASLKTFLFHVACY